MQPCCAALTRCTALPQALSVSEPPRDSRDLIPVEPTVGALRDAAARCTGCDLYKNATQTVFGEGPESARVMLVGEQPGDAEDLAGHPFVGPAGRLLDRCLVEAGIDRKQTYVTNVVKHFKWVPRGPRRIHSKPGAVEIEACFPWLEAEISVVKPQIVVARGASAVRKSFSGDPRARPARAFCARAFCALALRARDSASLGIAARPGRGDPPPRDRAFHRGFAPGREDAAMTRATAARRKR
jgi:uracil-DNA glycosylase family protein